MPEQEPVTLIIGAQKISAGLYRLSVTGGLLQMPEGPIRTGFATIEINTAFGPVTSQIEFLRTVSGKDNAMAFRFFHMYPLHYARLEQALKQMRQVGIGENQKRNWVQSLLRLPHAALEALPSLRPALEYSARKIRNTRLLSKKPV